MLSSLVGALRIKTSSCVLMRLQSEKRGEALIDEIIKCYMYICCVLTQSEMDHYGEKCLVETSQRK